MVASEPSHPIKVVVFPRAAGEYRPSETLECLFGLALPVPAALLLPALSVNQSSQSHHAVAAPWPAQHCLG